MSPSLTSCNSCVPVARNLMADQTHHPNNLSSTPMFLFRFFYRWPTERIILMLNDMFTVFDQMCDTYGVYKVETIGE